jgi:hypothetical protein
MGDMNNHTIINVHAIKKSAFDGISNENKPLKE